MRTSGANLEDARDESHTLAGKLRRTEAYFRALIENVTDLIAIVEADATIRYISPSVRRILGFEPEQLIGRHSLELVHPEDAAGLQAFMAGAIESGRAAAHVTYRHRHKDGSYRQLESTALNLINDDAVAGLVVTSRDITERVEIEARYRSLFENMVEGFAHCRMLYENGRPSDYVFLDVNSAFERIGLTDVVGRRLSEVIESITRTNADVIESFGRVVATGTPETFETYVAALDLWFSVSAYRTGPEEFVAIFDDVTERKVMEAMLRERLKEQTCVIAVNRDVQEGLPVDEVCRRAAAHLVRAMQFPELAVALIELDGLRSSAGAGAVPPGGLHAEIRVDGRVAGQVLVNYTAAKPFLLPEEQNVVNVVADLLSTYFSRKRAERQLQQSEGEYRGLVDHAPLGIYRVTAGGELLTVNPALVALLGYASSEELLGLNLESDVYVNREDRVRLIETSLRHDLAMAETFWRRKDGTHISVRVHLRPVRRFSEGAEWFDGLVEDVTEQRSLERQFLQAQKMEAVGRLAGGVAHDFNNLLTAIIGYTDLLGDQIEPADAKRADLHEIRAAAERATDLTRQLLAFSRKQVLQPRVLDLNAVVFAVEKMLQRLIGEDISLEIKLTDGSATVRADPGQMEQVILNLAVNARDAMPDGGKLLIETAHVELDEAFAIEHPLAPGPYVMLAVSDSGVGMDANVRAHIFEPFFTTKDQGKGTGLGLATVYGIVKQSGGYIWVHSEPGQGATFKTYLPRLQDVPDPPGRSADTGLVATGRETVLVVEDDARVRQVVARVLSQKGYTLLVAPDGATALALAEQYAGTIDLVVTDLVMPGMAGRELARALKSERAEVRVLFMSGYTDDAVFRHRVLDDGVHYLQKPFSGEALALKIRQVLDATG